MLLLDGRILVDLSSQIFLVVRECATFLFSYRAFSLLACLLLKDYSLELIPFPFSLSAKLVLFFHELLSSRFIQLSEKPCSLLHIELLNIPCLSLLRFKSSLGSECIDLRLPISSLLLHLSELLDLSLLLFLDSLLLFLPFVFGELSLLVVFHDSDVFIFFSLSLLGFHCLRHLVGGFYLK